MVIPVFNEEKSLVELHSQIIAVLEVSEINGEIIFLDDGSTDGSWKKITELAGRDGRVSGIKFRRNFGKAAALNEGFAAAKGDVIITLDADLQDDPNEMPRLLEKLAEGYDVVSGWKKKRHDPWHKVYPSKVFNWLVGWLTGVKLHDHNCGIKAYRREVVREVRLYGELHRFIPVLAHAQGFKIGEVQVNHRERLHGHSKYGIARFTKGFLDLLTVRFMTAYGERPLHVLGLIGLVSFAAGFIGLASLAVAWTAGYRPIGNRPVLFYSLGGLILGAQMLSFGILAELITWRSLRQNGQNNPPVSARAGGSYDSLAAANGNVRAGTEMRNRELAVTSTGG
jgi:glycosyltransferase involved in cell wall biosynthesis